MHSFQRSTHSDKLERWLGKEQVEHLSNSMRNWYGPPIAVAGVPGNVWACKGGDFRGIIRAGQLGNTSDFIRDRGTKAFKRWAQKQSSQVNTGFTSLSDIISEASTGKSRYYSFNKVGPTGVAGVTSSLWRLGPQPAVGASPGNAPGGTAFDDTSTGAFPFTNPSSPDTQHFVKGEVSASVSPNTLLLYDLIFGVNKTMNSTGTEAVTGVPTRYQSTTPSAMDYAGGNFLFIQVGGTALAATAHNWTVCQYTDEGGNTGATLPSLTGNASAITDRLDHPAQQWYAPLATGDVGVKALTQMQCSAAVATGVIWFMMGHPIAMLPCPVVNQICVTDGIMTAFNLVRVFDDACLTFLEITKPAATATTYAGQFQTVAG